MKSPEFCTQGGLHLARRSGVHSQTPARKGVIKLLRRQFGIRDNKGALPFGYNEHDEIHDYDNRIRMAIGVLDGDARLVVEDLQERMDLAADSLQYELAAQ